MAYTLTNVRSASIAPGKVDPFIVRGAAELPEVLSFTTQLWIKIIKVTRAALQHSGVTIRDDEWTKIAIDRGACKKISAALQSLLERVGDHIEVPRADGQIKVDGCPISADQFIERSNISDLYLFLNKAGEEEGATIS